MQGLRCLPHTRPTPVPSPATHIVSFAHPAMIPGHSQEEALGTSGSSSNIKRLIIRLDGKAYQTPAPLCSLNPLLNNEHLPTI